jgi:hypothetical protein
MDITVETYLQRIRDGKCVRIDIDEEGPWLDSIKFVFADGSFLWLAGDYDYEKHMTSLWVSTGKEEKKDDSSGPPQLPRPGPHDTVPTF